MARKRKALRAFIRENRAGIDNAIEKVCGPEFRRNDDERRLWVMNDEGLYLWAKSEGVRFE